MKPASLSRRPLRNLTLRAGPLRVWILICFAVLASTRSAGGSAMAGAPPLSARLKVEGPLGELPRFGINLGVRTVWGAEQLMSNVLRNPGLEPALDGALIVVGRTDFTGVEDDSRWTARPENFWAGARFEVLSGPAAGQQGQVLGNRRTSDTSPDRLTLSPMPAGVGTGDAIAVRGQQDATPAPLWWTEGRLRSVHDPRPGSPGQRSILLQAMPGQQASLLHHLDSIGARAGKLLPVDGEWHLSLWVRGETDDARLQLSFGRHGQNPWLNQTLRPGRSWTRIELPFKTRDDGPPGPLQLAVRALQGALLVDDLALGASPAQASPGGFRTEVVQNLHALRPGYLRDWQGQLADLPANRSAEPWARQPIRYRPGTHEMQFAYGLPEFLELAAAVGARPWVILPATATPGEARDLGRALAKGWRRHGFSEIVVEHGNEHWNTIFRPAGLARAATLAEVADRAFSALREGAGSEIPLHRVLGVRYGDTGAATQMARLSRHSEGVAVAPYLHRHQDTGETTEQALDRALHEDLRPLQQALSEVRPSRRSIDVYEVNFHTTEGNASRTERSAVLNAPEAGAALARRLLQAANLGVTRQAVYALAGYDSFVGADRQALAPLFGITRDLAGPGHWRPTGRALLALNAVMEGTAHAVGCTGTGCIELTALALAGGSRAALVSSAARPIQLIWPCSTAIEVHMDNATPTRHSCVKGLVSLALPPRAWVTLAPFKAQATE